MYEPWKSKAYSEGEKQWERTVSNSPSWNDRKNRFRDLGNKEFTVCFCYAGEWVHLTVL